MIVNQSLICSRFVPVVKIISLFKRSLRMIAWHCDWWIGLYSTYTCNIVVTNSNPSKVCCSMWTNRFVLWFISNIFLQLSPPLFRCSRVPSRWFFTCCDRFNFRALCIYFVRGFSSQLWLPICLMLLCLISSLTSLCPVTCVIHEAHKSLGGTRTSKLKNEMDD